MSQENPFDSPETSNPMPPRERSLALRILFGFLWFLLIWFVTNGLIGGVVGAIAGSQETTAEAAAQAGANAAINFFNNYRFIVLAVQITGTFALAWYEFLPGTRKLIKS